MVGETITFKEVADLVRQTVQPQDAVGMPYIGLEHIEEGSLRLNGYGQAEDVTSTKFRFSLGDILFGKLRPYFRKVIRAPFDGVCSTDIWVVRAKDDVEQGYLYYWMASQDFVDFATAGSEGTKMPRAKWEHVCRYEQAHLPKDEQRAIAHILGSLDDKIELNRKMNETLEAMARAIFKSWFIDFDPVRAKAEGRDPGLPKEIADIFPDEFENSELGDIPKGWEVVSFADTIEISGGGTPKTSVPEYWGGDIPWYAVGDAPKENDVFVIDSEKKITEAGVKNSSTRILPIGTTIMSARGTVGKLALTGVPMAMNQTCYGFKGKITNSDFFTFFSTRNLVSTLQQRTHGSVFDTITRDTLATVKVVLPSSKLVKQFETMVAPIMGHILNNLWQNQTLSAIRDALLPKLISGELRVPMAEKIAGVSV